MTTTGWRGHLIIGGVKFIITDVQLNKGGIIVLASCSGPLEAGGGYATIFGIDGQGIGQTSEWLEWPRVPMGVNVDLRWHLRVLSMIPREVKQ